MFSEIQGKTPIIWEKRGRLLSPHRDYTLCYNWISLFHAEYFLFFFPTYLIIFHLLFPQDLVKLINSNRVLVVSGETGCGKTTQVTQFILDDYINRGIGSTCRVVCTQPRRISAISVISARLVFLCLPLWIWIAVFNKVCVSPLSGSRACSSGAGGNCREWKFLWLPNPPAEVRKCFQAHVDA